MLKINRQLVRGKSYVHHFLQDRSTISAMAPKYSSTISAPMQGWSIISSNICKTKHTRKYGIITGSIATCSTTTASMCRGSGAIPCTWLDCTMHPKCSASMLCLRWRSSIRSAWRALWMIISRLGQNSMRNWLWANKISRLNSKLSSIKLWWKICNCIRDCTRRRPSYRK